MPHSEISGSKPVRGSPKLIAAYHVLHRLSAPRHPPDTLIALDYARNQKTDASKIPFTPPTTVFQSEKTSFASSTSGSPAVKLRAHDWLLRHGKRDAPSNRRFPLVPRRAFSGKPDALPLHNVNLSRDRSKGLAPRTVSLRTSLHSAERDALTKSAIFKLIFHRIVALWRRSSDNLVEPDGIEPTTSCLQSTRSPN